MSHGISRRELLGSDNRLPTDDRVKTVTHLVTVAELGGCEMNCLRVIAALPEFQHRVVVLGKEGPMSGRWCEAGAVVQHVDVLRLGSFAFERRLRQLAIAGVFRGAVLYWSNSRLFWVWRAVSGFVPFLTVHLGNPYGARKLGRLRDWIYERAAPVQGSIRLVACSQVVAESFRAGPFFRRLPTIVVPNPVDIIEPKVEHRDLGRQSAVRLGMVARLDPIKDHATLIRAMRGVLKHYPHATLELAGDGVLRAELAAIADREGIAHAVKFLGSVTDIPSLLRQWDLFVYSTTTDEGMGSAVAEALMAGLPALVCDIPVMREVCGDAAEYFAVAASGDLAKSAVQLIGDPARRSILAQAARARALDRYSPRRIAELYLGDSNTAVQAGEPHA